LEPAGSFLVVVVFNLMTVRAQDNALANLPEYRLAGKAAADHVGHVEVFRLSARMVKLQGSIVSESTPLTLERLLVFIQPLSQGGTPFVRLDPLAAPTTQPTVLLTFDHPANLKGSPLLLGLAILARFHSSLRAGGYLQKTTNPSGLFSGMDRWGSSVQYESS
jgi:hypothetical protein